MAGSAIGLPARVGGGNSLARPALPPQCAAPSSPTAPTASGQGCVARVPLPGDCAPKRTAGVGKGHQEPIPLVPCTRGHQPPKRLAQQRVMDIQ